MKTENTQIKLFEDKKLRSIWDKEAEDWYFSVVDVVAVLTESKDATAYWRKLKQRLKEEDKNGLRSMYKQRKGNLND